MGLNLVQKIFESHRVEGVARSGREVSLRVDQALMQDATGTMAWLQFEAIGAESVKIPLAVTYVDHNMLQMDHLNADDHRYLQTVSARYGAWFSRPGNGICHQVHLERFAQPGAVLLGSDSHTPTAGGMGSLAIGVGGLDVAAVMAGEPFSLVMPEVVCVRLTGQLRRPWVTAMDVVLELLRRLTVSGGVGKIFEYAGSGLKDLTLTERATITNFGAELGATTSIFPSDEVTLHYLKAQQRSESWTRLEADQNAEYADVIDVNLSSLEPLVAKPHQPDQVTPLRELVGLKIDQVNIGSCTNSSYQVMKTVAGMLRGRRVHRDLHLTVSPGSKQVLEALAREGALADIIASGARLLESGCGPCIGLGQAPPSGGVSLRSFNRNFKGRSGTPDAQVSLANPYTCALAAVTGKLTDPFTNGRNLRLEPEPEAFLVNDDMLVAPLPPAQRRTVQIVKGPNIKPVPTRGSLGDTMQGSVLIKVGDNISTDDIMPAGAKVLPLRSNIPAISQFLFHRIDPSCAERAKTLGRSLIVGGENYGQGSSREHAALVPMYLGVQAVIAKSFARIHRANLINFGILPLTFHNPADADGLTQGDVLEVRDVLSALDSGRTLRITNKTRAAAVEVDCVLSTRERQLVKAGGLLSQLRSRLQETAA